MRSANLLRRLCSALTGAGVCVLLLLLLQAGVDAAVGGTDRLLRLLGGHPGEPAGGRGSRRVGRERGRHRAWSDRGSEGVTVRVAGVWGRRWRERHTPSGDQLVLAGLRSFAWVLVGQGGTGEGTCTYTACMLQAQWNTLYGHCVVRRIHPATAAVSATALTRTTFHSCLTVSGMSMAQRVRRHISSSTTRVSGGRGLGRARRRRAGSRTLLISARLLKYLGPKQRQFAPWVL